MWLIIKKTDDTVYQTEHFEPAPGAYGPDCVVKFWDGPPPRKELINSATGDIIPGEKDPTLTADYAAKRRLAYLEADITAEDFLNFMYDDVLPALRSSLPVEIAEKLDARLDMRRRIKDEIPKLAVER